MGKPIYIQVTRVINQPLDKVWNTVALNYGNISEYNPAIKSSKYDSDKREGVGTKRHCDFPKKGYIKEEIIDWKDKESFKLQFTESSLPMKHLESEFHFKEIDGKTELTQDFWYRMGGIMGPLSGMMKGKFTKMLSSGLESLDEHLRKN